jgi:small-conductance mechanosensitive channel
MASLKRYHDRIEIPAQHALADDEEVVMTILLEIARHGFL